MRKALTATSRQAPTHVPTATARPGPRWSPDTRHEQARTRGALDSSSATADLDAAQSGLIPYRGMPAFADVGIRQSARFATPHISAQRGAPALAVQRKPEQKPLTAAQRGALLSHLISRLNSAEIDYRQACNEVAADVQAEQQLKETLAGLVVSVAASFVVPGLGGAITRLTSLLPAGASLPAYQAALLIQDQAPNIAAAIGEVGKTAAAGAIRAALDSNPQDFANALHEGFQETKDQIVGHVSANIENTTLLPDANLWLYVANWDPKEITVPRYKAVIKDLWTRYQSQVKPIGTKERRHRSTLDTTGYIQKTGAVWVTMGKETVLMQATEEPHAGKLEFVRWVDADLKAVALARAQSIQGKVPVVPRSAVRNLPSSAPKSAARK